MRCAMYKLCTMSTNYAQGRHVCTVPTNYTRGNVFVHSNHAQCLQTMHSVRQTCMCTVSTDYTRVNVYVYSVCKPRTVSTKYAQCLQTILG